MYSRTSEIPDLNKYATKRLDNDCFIDLEVGKLCLSYLLAEISEKVFVSYVFPDKNQTPLRMCRMQITKQAVASLSLRGCLHESGLKLNPHRTYFISVEIIGD